MDNPKTVIINITATDIRRGKQREPEMCPIARSVKRTLKATRVCIGTASGKAYFEGLREQTILLPNDIYNFRCDFDGGRAVKPGKYEIDVCPEG